MARRMRRIETGGYGRAASSWPRSAVQAAHQRGIIHRDLKPGNVRVDAAGRPRVLDFGLAKPLDASVWRSGASVSRSGHFLGSVPWASPEQASGAAGAADVRSDLYSLGVIAYRLLTEAMPYDTSGSIGDALRAVAETPPAPPRLLGRPLGRDLETVLLKSLAKEPSRRYQSVGEFVADLRRALAGEPIDARRDSAWYLLRMAARRHRAAVAAALLLLAMLVAGVAATSWHWRSAVRERVRADRRFDEVRGLANALMFQIHDSISDLNGSRPARELLVTTAMQYLTSLAAESGGDPALLIEVAAGHERLGDLLGNPNSVNLGDTGAALREYEHGLEILASIGEPESDDRLRRAVASLENRSGDVRTARGERETAVEHHRRALELIRGPSRDPASALPLAERRIEAATILKIGDALSWNSDLAPALASLEQATALLRAIAESPDSVDRDRFNLQIALNKVGFVLGRIGRLDEALERQQQALQVAEQLVRVEPGSAVRRRSVEIIRNQLGAMLLELGRTDEAIAQIESALASVRERVDADPGNRQAQADLAYTRNKMGEALWVRSAADALPHFQEALSIRKEHSDADPGNAVAHRSLAVSHLKVGECRLVLARERGAPKHAAASHARAAREHFTACADMLEALREKGTLAEVDAAMPGQARSSAAECDALLAELGVGGAPHSGQRSQSGASR